MNVQKMTDLPLEGQRVLIREDLNVPIKNGRVSSDARLRAALPTIQAAAKAGAKVMLMSHLGRPTEGEPAEEFSLAPVAEHLSELLGSPVKLINDYLGTAPALSNGDVVLLENVRFNSGEKKDDEQLAKQYAALCDIFVMGRLRHRPPRPGLYPRCGPLCAHRLCRPATGPRAGCVGESFSEPGPPDGGYCRWLQSLHQTRRAHGAFRQVRPADRRWRDRQHLYRSGRL